MKNDCKNCTDRHPCCWSNCEKYAKMKASSEVVKEARRKERIALNFLTDNIEKTRRKRNLK